MTSCKYNYSFFNSTAGLVRAAFRVCQSTARKEMSSAMATDTAKIHP